MPKPRHALALLIAAAAVFAPWPLQAGPQVFGQAPPATVPKGPVLEPGEGFAIALTQGGIQVFGEGRREGPLGSLTHLVWLGLEESEWASRMLLYKCSGLVKGEPCGPPKGHGRLDIPKALHADCHHAFQAWVQVSAAVWKDIYGSGGARARLVEAFAPFLGNRLPPGNDLPDLTAAWVGQGELLRTSPEAFALWLADPAQENLLDRAKRNLNHFFSESKWWFLAGTAPLLGNPAVSTAWAVGCDGDRVFVLSLPPGKSRLEALTRLKTILGLPKK